MVSSLCDLQARLDSRKKVSPDVFAQNMKLREETHHLGNQSFAFCSSLSDFIFIRILNLFADVMFLISTANYIPQGSVDELFPGTWYLTRVDEKHRRQYARRSMNDDRPLEAGLVSSSIAAEVCRV